MAIAKAAVTLWVRLPRHLGRVHHCLLASKANVRASRWRDYSVASELHVVRSPRPEVQVPALPLHELIWQGHEQWAGKVAVECGVTGRRYTYAQGRQFSARLAVALQATFGLAQGDCFAVLSPNLPEYPFLLLAGAEAGLIATTVNPLYTADEIAKQLRDSSAKLIVTVPACFDNATAAVRVLGKQLPILVLKDAPDARVPADGIPVDEVLRAVTSELKPVDHDVEAAVVLPYSSGTTGLPKGVQLSHRNLVANLVQMEVPGVRLLLETTPSQQDVVMGLLPMFHIYGMVVVALTTLNSGGKLVTLPSFQPKLFINTLVQHKVGLMYLVPPLILFLGGHPEVKPDFLSSIRAINSGAAPIGQADVERLLQRAPHIQMFQGYGMTELSPVALMTHRQRQHKLASTGVPLSSTIAKVVDIESGEALPARAVGELYFKGPQVMKGYLNREDANEDVFRDGWLRTGDMAYYDEEGDFFIVERLKELIKVKGFQVAPAELEEVLRTHPAVADAAVIGVDDKRSGEVPRAFVVAKADHTLDVAEVAAYVASKVAEYKQLAGGVVVLAAIPKSTAGKILRKDLKAQYGGSDA